MAIEGVPMDKVVQDHELRLTKLESGMKELTSQVMQGNVRAEQDNKYLREQNDRMFEKLVGINDRVHDRQHESRMLDKQNFWKLVFILVGSGGIAGVIVQLATKYILNH